MENQEFVIIAHNIRSAHNIGSILRTADGAGVDAVYLTGYSPAPPRENALHKTQAEKMIEKTALGAEKMVSWKKSKSIGEVINLLRGRGFQIIALEQSSESISYCDFVPRFPLAVIVGNEPRGIDGRVLKKVDHVVEIPMRGAKNSLNVSVAMGIISYKILESR